MQISLPIFGVFVFDSGKPGLTTTLMAGVHGNEKSGITILQELQETLQVISGKVVLIPSANPRAIAANIRQTEKNMNRAFHDTQMGDTYEDIRAQELIGILRQSDIFLDIHNTLNTENSVPFLICEHPEYAKFFPVGTIVNGLDSLHPGGSDGYMNSIGKIGLCLEAGSIHFDDDGVLARKSIQNFLRATGNIAGTPVYQKNQSIYHLDTIYKSETMDMRFIKKWMDFEPVRSGEIIGYDGFQEIRAPYDGVIVFTYEPKNIGDEICVFGYVG